MVTENARPMQLTLFIFFILLFQDSSAQSVGIGTATPDASAVLEINSTTKGVLIPSMTGSQRIALQSPAEGLLVYDLSAKRTFQYQDGIWRLFITNDYWAQSGSRKWVYNGTDSVGIGNAAPNERLHVSGNIRSTGDLKVTGSAGLGVATPEQTLHVRSPSAGEGILVEAVNPIVQFRQSNTPASGYTNKGFLQLAGDDIRIGTNSGNANGNFVIRNNGGDRVFVNAAGNMGIGVSNPGSKLDVQGNINASGKFTGDATGAAPLTPTCYGKVNDLGNIVSGSGNFTSSRSSTGVYSIQFSGINSNAVVVATGVGSNCHAAVAYTGAGVTVYLRDLNTNGAINAWFNFIIYSP